MDIQKRTRQRLATLPILCYCVSFFLILNIYNMYDKRIAKDINVDESTFEEVMDSIYYDEGSEFLHLILSKDFVLAKKRFEEYEKRMKIIKNDNTQSFDELEECAGCHKLTNQVLFDDLCDECSDF